MTHKKETSLSPDCLDDIYDDADENEFGILDDSLFITCCIVGTLLLCAVLYKLGIG
jgi:hypothetical protein